MLRISFWIILFLRSVGLCGLDEDKVRCAIGSDIHIMQSIPSLNASLLQGGKRGKYTDIRMCVIIPKVVLIYAT